MLNDNYKQLLKSILIGACVAFLSSLVDGLAHFIQTHATEIIGGTVSAMYHHSKTHAIV